MRVVVADSITALDADAAGAIVVTGSHGGRIIAGFAVAAGVAGLIVHDAGGGLDDAGTETLRLLDAFDLPCCAVSAASARIGDADDCLSRGVLSSVNRAAWNRGVRAGWAASDAARCLAARHRLPPIAGSRVSASGLPAPVTAPISVAHQVRDVWLLDTASAVTERHVGSIVVTGSHSALLGADPASAMKAAVFAAVFNDAGGADTSRLDVLDLDGVAAVVASHRSARIGDAASTFRTGRVTRANAAAARIGAEVGGSVADFVVAAARIPR